MNEHQPESLLPPFLAAILLGIVLISGAVYYRSVRILRFWEPALAMSTPRVEFGARVREHFLKHFRTDSIPGVGIAGESIFVDLRLFTAHGRTQNSSDIRALHELGSVLEEIFQDPATKGSFDFVILATYFPIHSPDADFTEEQRRENLKKNDWLLSLLFGARPELLQNYGPYFVTTSLPTPTNSPTLGLVEFRFIRAGRQHIAVLQQLEQYAR